MQAVFCRGGEIPCCECVTEADTLYLNGILSVQSNTRRIVSHGTTGGFTKSIVAVVQGSPQGGGVASTILELVE
jgi:hypothetical protein